MLRLSLDQTVTVVSGFGYAVVLSGNEERRAVGYDYVVAIKAGDSRIVGSYALTAEEARWSGWPCGSWAASPLFSAVLSKPDRYRLLWGRCDDVRGVQEVHARHGLRGDVRLLGEVLESCAETPRRVRPERLGHPDVTQEGFGPLFFSASPVGDYHNIRRC